MEIAFLSEHMEFADTVARWVYDEFIQGIRDNLSYEDVLSSVRKCHADELPIRLIAVDGGACMGTVSIVRNDLKCRDYTPWLASLYVHPPFRNQRIGERLIGRVKDIVKDMGWPEVYLRTEHASAYYRRLGWQYVESCEDEYGLRPDVFRFGV